MEPNQNAWPPAPGTPQQPQQPTPPLPQQPQQQAWQGQAAPVQNIYPPAPVFGPAPPQPAVPSWPSAAQQPSVRSPFPAFAHRQRAQAAQATQTQYPGQSPYLPQASYTAPTDFAAPSPSHKMRNILLALGVVVVLVGGGTAAYLQFSPAKTSASAVFNAALENALSTSSVTQTNMAGSKISGDTYVMKFDVANPSNPHMSAVDTIAFDGKTVATIKGYGSLKNTYANITQASTATADQLNKWVQVRKDGTLPKDATESDTLYPTYDPRYSMLGNYLFGNLSASNRKALVDYMVQNQVYKYDPSKVTKATLNGVSVYKYAVTMQHGAELNQKAAQIFGITDKTAIQEASSATSAKATLYVAIQSPRLLKVAVNDGSTVQYSDYNATKVTSEPKADIQYDAYLALSGTATDSQDTDSAIDTTVDVTRQSDLLAIQDSLEGYFATTGNYPTLTDMNSSDWVDNNLSDFDQTALQDPDGSSPTLGAKPAKNQYSYQVGVDSRLGSCEADETTCQYYVLTATLSDGTTYTLKDLADS